MILGLIAWYMFALGRREIDLMQARRGRERKLWVTGTGFMHLAMLQILLGALVEILALRANLSPEWRAFLVVGCMGAFTTFSTFSLDTVTLAARGEWAAAAVYIGGSVLLSVGAFLGAMRLFRLILGPSV